jgi:predicted glycosyltransferase
MAYLHPNYFHPNEKVLEQAGLEVDEVFSVVRFVGWSSSHDINKRGFSESGKVRLVEELRKHGRVFISSEEPLPEEIQAYAYHLPKSMMHHLLAYASLYVGESATMASESAILGTHALYVAPVGRGYTDEQEDRYGLVYNYIDQDENLAINKAGELLSREDLKLLADKKAGELLSREDLKLLADKKRNRMLEEKIDLTSWIVDFIDQTIVEKGLP